MTYLRKIAGLSLSFMLYAHLACGNVDTLTMHRLSRNQVQVINEKSRCEYIVDLDVVSSSHSDLNKAVNTWVISHFSQSADLSGLDYQALDSCLNVYGKQYILHSKKRIQKLLKNRSKDSAYVFSEAVRIKRVYETPRIITMAFESTIYNDTIKGKQTCAYASFIKASGKIVGWNDLILSKQRVAFSRLLVGAIQSYMGVMSFESLWEQLNIKKNYTSKTFPLPEGTPGLMASHLVLQYAPEEICTWKKGCPSADISYSQLRKILTPKIKELLKQ